jgi:hypothetical protein
MEISIQRKGFTLQHIEISKPRKGFPLHRMEISGDEKEILCTIWKFPGIAKCFPCIEWKFLRQKIMGRYRFGNFPVIFFLFPEGHGRFYDL